MGGRSLAGLNRSTRAFLVAMGQFDGKSRRFSVNTDYENGRL